MLEIHRELIKQRGAIEFVNFLRGKIDADLLASAWEDFSKQKATEINRLKN